MNAPEFLSRLEKVKRTAEGEWVACCPAHEDRSPSLAVKEAQDGRILVHCFAGCSFESVCGAAGVEITDLFPERQKHDALKPLPFNPRTLLKAIAFNTTIVAICASDMAQGKALSVEEKEKLFEIAEELNAVVDHAAR
ncbi:MAG: CHC2 zinc finger domain-containing protein [Gemmatimonadales bacterium]